MGDVQDQAPHDRRPQRDVRGAPDRRGARGKLIALAGLLRDHYDAVEADFQRFYGVDLGGLWRGELSLRRVSALVTNLPPESATWAAENGEALGASRADVLLADIFQAVTGQPHPLRPQPKDRAAVEQHESTAARLRAQRARVAAQRPKEAS
ncbi:hypothetical protein GCM10010168_53250 [Actinoplanes ianthinogenes]|uniref:DUF222 domain-containing protein n=1 Tax=Actinoplanes ianthinogenes TaxID=122358 RepID=A0ABN6C8E3_9ACTN|nr:hypothetical protein Aiant_23340 [Actinoplanes ianthinogenes]GGR28473.1 hypothetical protein GCM10010168_53250 [Actinoplanes ianthinogenes]